MNSVLQNFGRIGTEIVQFGSEGVAGVYPGLFEHLFGPEPDVSGIPVEAFVFFVTGGVGGKTIPLGKMKIDLRDDPFHFFGSTAFTI